MRGAGPEGETGFSAFACIRSTTGRSERVAFPDIAGADWTAGRFTAAGATVRLDAGTTLAARRAGRGPTGAGASIRGSRSGARTQAG